jgi:hypothetical protein
MIIAYAGTSDAQGFSKSDFAKVEVEQEKDLLFKRGEPTEVSDEVGEVLISKDGLFGDYNFVKIELDNELEEEEQTEAARTEAMKAAEKESKKKAKDGGAPSVSGSPAPSGPKS